MIDEVIYNQFSQVIIKKCIEYFSSTEDKSPIQLADEIMAVEGFPMHSPIHHFLVPAVLLSVCRKAQGCGAEALKRDLQLALERSKNVIGGFCGFYGTCGAAVGLGIFWCIMTDCSPLSHTDWSHGNAATGQALTEIARYGGPRCCKRCTNLTLFSSYRRILAVLGIHLVAASGHVCRYSQRNNECLKEECPFYSAMDETNALRAIFLPTFAYPVRDPDHPCACQDCPVELTHKDGLLFWRVSAGDRVDTDTLIAVFESEKKAAEIYAPASGVLRELLVEDGGRTNSDAILAYLEAEQS